MKEVLISAFDQDVLATSSTTTLIYNIDTLARFNGQIYNNSALNTDTWKYTRYFPKSGIYKCRIIYTTQLTQGIINIGLDANATSLFSSLDTYSGSTVRNNTKEAIVNISRGYHDIKFAVNGKNASSLSYQILIQALQFDLIAESAQYKEDQYPIAMPDGAFNRPKIQFATLASNYTTTSTTAVSTGTGVTMTSPHTDRMLVMMQSIVSNGTITDGVTIQIYRSTVGIPAQGSAINAGDTSVYLASFTAVVAALANNPSAVFIDSGLVPNQTYYYYITVKSNTAGTTTINGGTNQTTITAEPV